MVARASWSYDAADRVVTTTYPSGEVITATYDAGMQPLTTGSSLKTYVTAATYTALGQPAQLSLGNSLKTRYWYYGPDTPWAGLSNYGRLRRLCVLPQSSGVDCEADPTNTAPLINLGYNHSKVGNLTILIDERNNQRQQFNYDALDRLISAVPNPLTGRVSFVREYTETYAYSPVGNLLTRTLVLSGSTQLTRTVMGYGSLKPHAVLTAALTAGAAVSVSTYAYDANGNMTRRVELSGTQLITFSQGWDAENRLITVTWSGQAVTFTYDADGVLVRRSQTGQVNQTMLYVGGHYEVNATTGVTTSYYAFGSLRVAMRQGATVTWLHGDHLGSASLATNVSGGQVSQLRYYPYGGLRWCRRGRCPPTGVSRVRGVTRPASGCTTTGRAITTRSSAGSSPPTRSCPSPAIRRASIGTAMCSGIL